MFADLDELAALATEAEALAPPPAAKGVHMRVLRWFVAAAAARPARGCAPPYTRVPPCRSRPDALPTPAPRV